MRVEFECPKCRGPLTRMTALRSIREPNETRRFVPIAEVYVLITQQCPKCKFNSVGIYPMEISVLESYIDHLKAF